MIREGLKLSHPELANGRWAEMSFAAQMGNLGSEISRALKAKARGNTERMMGATDRAIELFELSIDCNSDNPARLKELCRGKEEFCNYIFDGDTIKVDPSRMMRYYDQFVSLARKAA